MMESTGETRLDGMDETVLEKGRKQSKGKEYWMESNTRETIRETVIEENIAMPDSPSREEKILKDIKWIWGETQWKRY